MPLHSVQDPSALGSRHETTETFVVTEIEIISAPAPTEELRQLVGELEAVLSAEYPPEQRHGLTLEAIFQPHIRFFVARLHGMAVGCDGVALLDGFAEVKRMYGLM